MCIVRLTRSRLQDFKSGLLCRFPRPGLRIINTQTVVTKNLSDHFTCVICEKAFHKSAKTLNLYKIATQSLQNSPSNPLKSAKSLLRI